MSNNFKHNFIQALSKIRRMQQYFVGGFVGTETEYRFILILKAPE